MDIFNSDGVLLATSDTVDGRRFEHLSLQGAYLVGCDLEGVSFTGSDLRGANLRGADLYGATLCDTNLEGCNMTNVDLRSSFIFRVSFRGADLQGARFSQDELGMHLNIAESDFTDANLSGADFSKCTFDKQTIFPVGFDPILHGMSLSNSIMIS